MGMGNSETVSLLMKADCNLVFGIWGYDVYDYVPRRLDSRVWAVSQEARTDVLDTAISSLAERRRNLQSRLAALSAAVEINPGVFQDDRILDEYAQYAERVEEDVMRGNDHTPRHASSLLPGCRSVYHVRYMTVEFAEKLWQNGFRDVDVPNKRNLTPLMFHRVSGLINQIEVSSWLIKKGAKLHRLQYEPLDYDADPTFSSMELPLVFRALHYVAYNIGISARALMRDEQSRREKRQLRIELRQLSKEARLLATTVFLDVSCDDCICACSSQGCLASTMMLKSFSPGLETSRTRILLATELLVHLVGPSDSFPASLAKEIIRFQTFQALELRHTCCEWHQRSGLTRHDSEEHAEIRDEDHERIELLEELLQEFEENRGTQDVLSFLKGYWTLRMEKVLRETGHVDKEAIREIGVIVHEEDEGGIVGNGRDEKANDEDGSDAEWLNGGGSDDDGVFDDE